MTRHRLIRSKPKPSACAAVALSILIAAACTPTANEDVTPSGDGGGGGGERANPSIDTGDGGTFALAPFTPPADPGGGGVLFTASGEALALTGYAFPPSGDAPAFVDGWEVRFSHLLTTIGRVTLSDNPDLAPGDASRVGGPIASVTGPFAVDLARSDGANLPGKGGPGEQAVKLAAITSAASGAALKTDGTRYAFGFNLVGATSSAKNVNLEASALVAYREMIGRGCVTLYVGRATWKGDKASPSCYPPAYANVPEVVDFELCFKSPATYVNCQNPDNDPATPFADEEHQRGIALLTGQSVLAQVTVHTDHPFWDSVLHDTPLHFDQYAARAVGSPDAGTPKVTLEMTQGVDYTAYQDARGTKLPWRYCMEPATDVHPKLTGAMAFDSQAVPHATGGDPATGLRDYYDFATYNQSTQGHLNSDGLCFVERDYPSPR